jgi:hypothetical protein
VSAVKSLEDIASLADAEAFLREVGGLSKSQAVGFIARVKAASGRSEPDEMAELRQLLERRGKALVRA